MTKVETIIKDNILTYEQKVLALAKEAENSINVLNIDEKTKGYIEEGIICTLFEGNAPYRPRYILPDYEKLMKEGCKFLKLDVPSNIHEAVNTLLIFYKHVPSITSFPVYIGNIDTLLDPYIEDEEEAYQAIKLFLMHIDRTLTDSFCHANIGPQDTKAGRLILKAERELQDSIPNITMKVSKETNEQFIIEGIKTALVTAKPSFANHEMFSNELGENYGIASCYNGLNISGGSYTLTRLNLASLAKKATSVEDFLEKHLPKAVNSMCGYMDERVRYLVEESGYFESTFLVRENFINREEYTAMFGMVGLAECVNTLLKVTDIKEKFGHSEKASELGLKVIEKLEKEVNNHHNKYCKNGKFLLHAQVGIDTDFGISPGCRIPIGDEPELFEQINVEAPFHKYFPSGIGNIYAFDSTVKDNTQYVLDIMKGAFNKGMRYFSVYSSDCDVVRITGYLVKRSEIEKLSRGEQVLRDTVVLGKGSVENQKVLDRKLRSDE
ncbi:YjjI family glycine radical enzyme [Clostridiaceae bacterium M8S5]|nr:YjjI family glycine radical enzyme [Clostridiaceae bacterium M8S5]